MDKEMAFEDWANSVPKQLKGDPLWQSAYYRLAMYLYDLVWLDTVILNKDFRGREIVHQLIRSTCRFDGEALQSDQSSPGPDRHQHSQYKEIT
jgi:hypothetical protein